MYAGNVAFSSFNFGQGRATIHLCPFPDLWLHLAENGGNTVPRQKGKEVLGIGHLNVEAWTLCVF